MLVKQADGTLREEGQTGGHFAAVCARWERRFAERADGEYAAREEAIHRLAGEVGDKTPAEWRETIVRVARTQPLPSFRARGGKAGARYQSMAREVETTVRRQVADLKIMFWKTPEWERLHHPEEWAAIYPRGVKPTFGE